MKTLKTLLQEITAGIKAWANASFSSGTHVHGNIANNGKLATASKVVISDSNKNITTSNVSDTELGYLSGVTSAIQTQISSKAYDADVMHTTGNETIAGTKTFASEIDGTASKAVADEDGNNIKSTYGKLASANTWSGSNSFSQPITETNGRIYRSVSTLTRGTNPTTTSYYGILNDYDSTGSTLCNQFRGYISSAGSNYYEQNLSSWDGTSTLTLQLYITSDGTTKNYSIGANTLPLLNNAYSLGSSSYQWSSVYAQTYYYNGTAWGLDKANVWSGTNNYKQSLVYNDTVIVDKTIPSAYRTADTFKHMGSDGAYWGGLKHNWLTDGYSRLQICVANHALNNGTWSQGFWTVNLAASKDFSDVSFYPSNNNVINLGTSTNKWKTLNGVNLGALSFPNLNASNVNIDTTGWDLTNYGANRYTALVDGYIVVSGTMTYLQIDIANKPFGLTVNKGSDGYCICFVPMIKGDVAQVRLKDCTNLRQAKFYPCLGNV